MKKKSLALILGLVALFVTTICVAQEGKCINVKLKEGQSYVVIEKIHKKKAENTTYTPSGWIETTVYGTKLSLGLPVDGKVESVIGLRKGDIVKFAPDLKLKKKKYYLFGSIYIENPEPGKEYTIEDDIIKEVKENDEPENSIDDK